MTQPEASLVLSVPPEEVVQDVAPVVSDPTGTPAIESPEEEFIRIRRGDINKEIARLQNDDPDFANAFNTAVGRKAARQYQSRLDEAETTANNYRKLMRRNELLSMPPTEVNTRFNSDPAFAREYSELVHHDPQQAQQELYLVRLRNSVETILGTGSDHGLSDETLQSYRNSIAAGKYSEMSDLEALNKISSDIMGEVLKIRQTAPESTITPTPIVSNGAVAQTTTPAPSPALTAGPDMSPAGSRTGVRQRFTGTQIRMMSVEEKIALWPTDADYQRDVVAGLIDYDQ